MYLYFNINFKDENYNSFSRYFHCNHLILISLNRLAFLQIID